MFKYVVFALWAFMTYVGFQFDSYLELKEPTTMMLMSLIGWIPAFIIVALMEKPYDWLISRFGGPEAKEKYRKIYGPFTQQEQWDMDYMNR
jgi:hypothetical protein